MKNFKLYSEYKEQLEILSNEDRGILLIALFNYAESGIIPELSESAKIVFFIIKKRIDRDNEISQINSQNGLKGGRPKAVKENKPEESENNRLKPTETEKKRIKATETEIDSDKKLSLEKPDNYQENKGSEFVDVLISDDKNEENQVKENEERKESTKEKKEDKENIYNIYINKTKEKKENDIKEKKEKSVFGEFGLVRLLDEEYKKLNERLGNDYLLDYIARLDGWLAEGNKKKNHYATILNWWRKDEREKQEKQERYKALPENKKEVFIYDYSYEGDDTL